MKILVKVLSLIAMLSFLSSCIESPADDPVDEDTTAPMVTSSDPGDGQTNVSVHTNLTQVVYGRLRHRQMALGLCHQGETCLMARRLR